MVRIYIGTNLTSLKPYPHFPSKINHQSQMLNDMVYLGPTYKIKVTIHVGKIYHPFSVWEWKQIFGTYIIFFAFFFPAMHIWSQWCNHVGEGWFHPPKWRLLRRKMIVMNFLDANGSSAWIGVTFSLWCTKLGIGWQKTQEIRSESIWVGGYPPPMMPVK